MHSHEPAPRQPAAARSPYLGAVRDAWRGARAARDPRGGALVLALRMFARDGHARGVPVSALLRALDSLVSQADAGDQAGSAGFDAVREWAGTEVIRAYYCAD